MVMDAQPSPQNVGREFVRQYYTLLNKAPDFLHRFYNSSSSFVHGGLDAKSQDATLVVGSKQIQNKIQQLNFRDCHAKISQVDSQATLGNGVVVQVTGELSNDGQPMRRFTQTFVLASQSPKKYYVHNDIFRYQDVYTDDELDEVCERANGSGTDEDGLHSLGADGSDSGTLVVGETQLGSGPGTTANATAGLVGVGSGVHGHPTQPGQQPVLGSQTAAPQALFYPSNVISSSGAGLLPGINTYGAPPSGAQSQPTSQQQQSTHQPSQQQTSQPQQLNGLHESLLKNVSTSEGATAAAVAAVLLSSSTDPQGLKSKMDTTPMGVPSHLLPGQQQQQPHQSQLNQTQPPTTTNQLGLGQSQQQLPLQSGQQQHLQQQPNRHLLSDVDTGSLNLNDPIVTAAVGVGSASHVDVLSSSDLDKKPQQHKSHQQQLHQKQQQLGSGNVGFGKQQQQQQPVSLEPKTYANLVKSGVSSGTPLSFASAMQASLSAHTTSQQSAQPSAGQQQQQSHQQQQQPHQHQTYSSSAASTNTSRQQQQRDILSPTTVTAGVNQNAATNGGGVSKYGTDRQDDRGSLGNGSMSQPRSQQQRSMRTNGTSSNTMGGGSLRQQDNRQSSYARQNYNDSEDRRQGSSSQFGDNHQLFLGNIPHHATEEELKTLFSKFGTVVDLRIMSKSVQKMPGMRTPPHYGFITYDDPASVQTCLANMPLYFPENSPDGHKLNVEEKKTRVRGPGEGSGRMSSGGSSGIGSANSNGPRAGGTGSGQSRPPGGQGGVSSNRGGGGTGQRSLGGGNVGGGGGGSGGNRGNSGSYGQRSDRGNNVGNGQRSVGNANGISNRGFGSGY
ncbi:uncharacterized protein LOC126568337 [Anopheles maculipalpis]|uniref:uncharacterized protein LOC126568337 n=1 Tax=Anopheles maculipalpis TaxID=1496333 RepID=UPI002159544F|nr:uncharacterized protein LOC126568337 [Anopheles maculipalpis]